MRLIVLEQQEPLVRPALLEQMEQPGLLVRQVQPEAEFIVGT